MPLKPKYGHSLVYSGGRFVSHASLAKKRRAKRNKSIMKMVHELKSANVTFGSTSPGTTWTEVLSGVDTIVTGDSSSTRDGNRVKAEKLNLRVLLTTNNNASSNPYQGFRIMVVKPSGGIALAAADFPSNGMTGVPNQDQLNKYRVLLDKTYYLNEPINAQNAMEVLKEFNIKLNHNIEYAGSATADPTKGGIEVWIISDDNTYSGAFVGEARLFFRDN